MGPDTLLLIAGHSTTKLAFGSWLMEVKDIATGGLAANSPKISIYSAQRNRFSFSHVCKNAAVVFSVVCFVLPYGLLLPGNGISGELLIT